MKSAISEYFSEKKRERVPRCFEEDVKYHNSYLLYKNVKIHILPILLNYNDFTVASLKLPCDAENVYSIKEAPLENFQLPFKKPKKKKERLDHLKRSRKICSELGPSENLSSSGENDFLSFINNKYCRNNKYPNTNCDRFYVPDEKVQFKIEYKDYKRELIPFIEVSNNVLNVTKDKNKIQCTTENYLKFENVPKNPVGRTGIIGRGVFKNFGPNKFAFLVVTKYKRTFCGSIEITNISENTPNYQFLAYKSKIFNDEWAIPNGFSDNDDFFLSDLPRPLTSQILFNKLKTEYLHKLYGELFIDSFSVYDGYLDDYINTDDAWVHAKAENYHHENDEIQLKLNRAIRDKEMNPDNIQFEWIDFTNEKIYSPHEIILYFTKKHLDLKWYNKTI